MVAAQPTIINAPAEARADINTNGGDEQGASRLQESSSSSAVIPDIGPRQRKCLGECFVRSRDAAFEALPILSWAPLYNIRAWLLDDVVAGLTLSTLVVPQAMAYAHLAGIPPVYGLYSAIIPPLIYAAMGLSPFQNIGPFAVTSLMMYQLADAVQRELSAMINLPLPDPDNNEADMTMRVSVVNHITFVTAILLHVAYMLNLGTPISSLLPPALIQGFTVSSSVLVVMSQLASFTQRDGFSLPSATWAGIDWLAVGLAAGTVLVVFVVRFLEAALSWCSRKVWAFCSGMRRQQSEDLLSEEERRAAIAAGEFTGKPLQSSRIDESSSCHAFISPGLLPDVFIAIFFATLFSYCMDFSSSKLIRIVGVVPEGFPAPRVPWLQLDNYNGTDTGQAIFYVTLSSIPGCAALAIVSFVTTLSITKTFGFHVGGSALVTPKDKDATTETRPSQISRVSVDADHTNMISDVTPRISFNRMPQMQSPAVRDLGSEGSSPVIVSVTTPPPDGVSTESQKQRRSRSSSLDVPMGGSSNQATPPYEANSASAGGAPLPADPYCLGKIAPTELLALSTAMLFSPIFSALNPCGSLSRSALIVNQTRARSHLASLFSAIVVLVVVLWLTPVFYHVPLPALAGIIIFAMLGMLARVRFGFQLLIDSYNKAGTKPIIFVWKDAVTWWLVFLVVILLDAGTGIVLGICTVSIFRLIEKVGVNRGWWAAEGNIVNE